MSEYKPVSTIDDLNTLNEAEIIEGYWAGTDGWPEPGNNRSRSYWHGWRNGSADRGRIPYDEAMKKLAHEVVERRIRQ